MKLSLGTEESPVHREVLILGVEELHKLVLGQQSTCPVIWVSCYLGVLLFGCPVIWMSCYLGALITPYAQFCHFQKFTFAAYSERDAAVTPIGMCVYGLHSSHETILKMLSTHSKIASW